MKYIQKEQHYELHPENQKDVDQLREEYPLLWPFEYVCVANPHRDDESK